jgi:hypothetical protein
MVIGVIDGVQLGTLSDLVDGLLPWDASNIKASVMYQIRDDSYSVTASNISYLHRTMDVRYNSIYEIIYKASGELRRRGDGDLRYFDNALCELLLIEE